MQLDAEVHLSLPPFPRPFSIIPTFLTGPAFLSSDQPVNVCEDPHPCLHGASAL